MPESWGPGLNPKLCSSLSAAPLTSHIYLSWLCLVGFFVLFCILLLSTEEFLIGPGHFLRTKLDNIGQREQLPGP